MKKLLWFSIGLLGACTAGPLEGGRYACVYGGAEDQCPSDWRCGLEGYCHRLGDVSKQWRCELDSHCENGWRCGLDEARDGGECHDPAGKSPHACFDDTQCTANWHCGPAGRCYDRTVLADHLCRFDAGDCADNWRCGLNGRCQDQDAGAPYPCLGDAGIDDSWCEQGWRCSPEGQCLNPSGDALRSLSFTPGPMEWMNPVYLQRRPAMLGVSEPFGSRQSIAFVDQGRLVYLERTFGEVPLGVGSIGLKVEAAMLSSPMAIAAVERRIFASSSSGLTEYTIGLDGSVSIEVPSPAGCAIYMYKPVAHRHLRNNAGIQGVIAFSDSPDAGFSVLVPSGCNVNLDFAFQGSHLAPLRINDMAALLVPKADAGHPDDECYLMADSRGLWAADFDNTVGDLLPFVPIDSPLFPNRSCGASSDQQIVGLKVTAAEFLVVRSQLVDGGPTESLSIASLKPLIAQGAKPCYTTQPCRSNTFPAPLEIDGVFGPCPVCNGGRIQSFFAVADLPRTTPAIEVRCEAVPDAGVPQQSYLLRGNLAGGCASTLIPGIGSLLTDDVIASLASQTGVAYAGSHGQIWTGVSSENAPPLTLDRPPDGVSELRLFAEDAGRMVAISPEYLGMHDKAIGYVGFSPVSPDRIVGSVDGAPKLAFTNRKAVLYLDGLDPSKGPRLIAFSQESSRFDPPYAGAVTAVTDAGAHLFLAADDRIFTAQLRWASTTPSSLTNRGAAVPGLQVTSLAAVPAGSAGLGAAWILSGQRLVYVVSGQNAWQRLELPVPLVSGAFPMEVWADGVRGRLGYTDGSVFSLPSRVQIGHALPTAQRRVVDYAAACGQVFALAPEGLFRLAGLPGKTVANWEPVATGAIGLNGFEGGRLHAVRDELNIFTAFGESARLQIAPCTSP